MHDSSESAAIEPLATGSDTADADALPGASPGIVGRDDAISAEDEHHLPGRFGPKVHELAHADLVPYRAGHPGRRAV